MKIKIFQNGGSTPTQETASVATSNSPQDQAIAEIENMALQIIQSIGPEASMMLAQMIVELVESSTAQMQPVGAPQGGEQQFMRKGGKICKSKMKKACGSKMRK